MRFALFVAASLALLSSTTRAQSLGRWPPTLVAGSNAEVLLLVPTLPPGGGLLRAKVNVGQILALREQAGKLVLRYRPPKAAHPHSAC
jgi:hypothetical protein